MLTILAALAMQDPADAYPAVVRNMVAASQPPTTGDVAIDTRFSDRVAYVGEQVELVTSAWFPRDLRERLRRQPTLKAPPLSGLWSVPGSELPALAVTRRAGGHVYDLFIAHRSLFPLSPGLIEAPSAVLSYAVPSSVSFFAPEDRKSLASRPVSIRILPIPASLVTALGNGPTARSLQVAWRVPNTPVNVTTPVTVELIVSGVGNVTLWPEPTLEWPASARIYAEPTREELHRVNGMVAGEKIYRYTLVPDSVGVITLPAVTYPYFDPVDVAVNVARASAVPLVVQPLAARSSRIAIPITGVLTVPWATRIVDTAWPLLIVVALLPLLLLWWGQRRHAPHAVSRPRSIDPIRQLTSLLGVGTLPASPELELALRRRGVGQEDANQVGRWLAERSRARWAEGADDPKVDAVLERVIRELHRRPVSFLILCCMVLPHAPVVAQTQLTKDAASRYEAGDAAGAERLFEAAIDSGPRIPGAWFNLGAARALAGDHPGAVASWLQGLAIAPRDPSIRSAIAATPDIPEDVLRLRPSIPLSRDELIILALVAWLLAAGSFRRARRVAIVSIGVAVAASAVSVARFRSESMPRALVREATPIRVSPTPDAPVLSNVVPWGIVTLDRRRGAWLLIATTNGAEGWLPAERVAPLTRLN